MSEHVQTDLNDQFFQTCSVSFSLTLPEIFTLFYVLDFSLMTIKDRRSSSDLDNQQLVIESLHNKFIGLFHGHGFQPIVFKEI